MGPPTDSEYLRNTADSLPSFFANTLAISRRLASSADDFSTALTTCHQDTARNATMMPKMIKAGIIKDIDMEVSFRFDFLLRY